VHPRKRIDGVVEYHRPVGRFAALSITWLLCIAASACGGNDGPTAPSPSTSFNGQWTGTTSQGQPITITVSSDRVTTVTVGYSYSGCSGSKTATDLNLEIVDVRKGPLQIPPGTPPYGFGSLLGPYSESDNTQINGMFREPSERSGSGFVLFVRPGCGESFVLYTVTKR
jgi:hypothetical protein